MHKKHFIGLAGLLLVIAITIGLMSMHRATPTSMSSTAVTTNHVTIQNYMFMPATITVKVGTTVTWQNMDSVNHTVTADKPTSSAPSSMDIAPNKTYSFTFKTAGSYTYHCFPHPYMHGTVEVVSS